MKAFGFLSLIITGFGSHGSRLSHLVPVNPARHEQIILLFIEKQRPLFWHYTENISRSI